MQEVINGYIKYQMSEGISEERTLNKYLTCIHEFLTDMNIKSIEQIDEMTWIDIKVNYINVKKQTLGSQSINLRITSIRSFFNYLEGMRLIKENVADRIKKEKITHREVDVDVEKIKDLLQLLDDEYNEKPCYMTARNKMIIMLALFVGTRNEETREMNIDDINALTGEFITHDSKFNKSRRLFIPKQLLPTYRKYLEFRNLVDTDCNKLFLSKSGKQLGKNAPAELIKNRSKKVGLDYNFHDLRHVAGTLSLMSGNSIEDTSKILGHSNCTITSQVYANHNDDMIKETINNNILLNNLSEKVINGLTIGI